MKHIHIVTFDIPYPANYGGVIDVFYRIKALSEAGVKVHLHSYKYGREQTLELNKYCVEVNYYKRETHPRYALKHKPYIVNSRSDKALLKNLQKDDYPILFEGLHSTHLLKHESLKKRYKIVRAHNIEHEYYWHLFKAEQSLVKKVFFASEALKLKYHESVLKYADVILSISANDRAHFQKYGRSVYVPAFSPDIKYMGMPVEVGHGILYHGNLSVSENIKAVLYLLDNVFCKIDLPVTIAGKNPAEKIIRKASKLPNVRIVADPSEHEMLELITKAQINILITFQSTGIKLKLLTALQYGKHCIVNKEMIEKTGLSNTCNIANSPEEIITAIYKLHSLPFGETEHLERQKVLRNLYSNTKSAKTILELL